MDGLCSHFIDVHSLTAHFNTLLDGNSLGIQALERWRFRVQRLPLFPAMHGPVGFKIVYHYTSWLSLQAIICTGIFPGATSCKRHVYMTRHVPREIEGTKHPVHVTPVNWATNTSTRLWIVWPKDISWGTSGWTWTIWVWVETYFILPYVWGNKHQSQL